VFTQKHIDCFKSVCGTVVMVILFSDISKACDSLVQTSDLGWNVCIITPE